MEYRRIGDYIKEVDSRNRDLKITKLVGLTINKAFIPSVANVIGTDLSSYKVIQNEQFACSLMQVSRDGKIPVAMFEDDAAIMSPAYPMFEVVDKEVLLPQYLMMWFSRSEFDREASFYAVGGVRGSLTWEDFCNMKLPVPSIDRQHEIVEEYETLSHRIRLNEQMIEKLEATAQALYRKMFVDNIDKENLPEGWSVKTLGEVCKNITDGVHNTVDDDINGDYLLLSCKNIKGGRISIGENERRIDFETFKKLRKRTQLKKGDILMSSVGTIGELVLLNEEPTNYEFQRSVAIIRADKDIVSPSFLFFSLKSQKDMIEQTAHGAVQRCLFISDIANLKTIYPPSPDIIRFTELTLPLLNYIHIRHCENSKLSELQSLLLAKMGKLNQ